MHVKWTESLLEEFFRQGDKEKELGLPFSPLCDRNTTLIAESQIGNFLNLYYYQIKKNSEKRSIKLK